MVDEQYLMRMKEIMLIYGFGAKMIQRMLRAEGYTVPKSNKTIAVQMNKIIESMTAEELYIWRSVSTINDKRHFKRAENQ